MAYGGYLTGYGGAPLAQVTSTRATTWSIGGRPVSTRATTWRVLAQVTSTRATTWASLASVAGSVRSTTWSAFVTPTGATTVPMMRLRVYMPNGADLGVLPTPEGASASYVMSDVGGLAFSYSPRAPKAALLGQPCELAVEVSPDSGLNWQEPQNSRFCYLSDGRDPISRTDRYAVEAKSWVWRFEKAKILPNGLLNADGKRAFNTVTPGTLLKTLFQEAQTRGALVGVTHASFSTTTDSSGAAWASRLTIAYEPGLSYLAVLQNLADQGFVDFRTQGRALQVYNPDAAMAVDRTVGSTQVVFRAGRDLTDAPFRRTWEGLANYAYFAGDAASYEFIDTTAAAPWGRMETFISNGSVSDQGTMAALTQTELATSNAERTEYTRGLDFSRSTSKPTFDYGVGDYVWSSVDGQLPVRLRIRQLTLTNSDKNILSGNVVLNDRFLESDVRAKRRIEGITNGASSGPGDGGPSTDPGTDKTIPNPPTALTGSTAAYLGAGGYAQAQVSLSWAAPTTNTNGTIIDDLDHYELFERVSTSPAGSQRNVATTTDVGIDRSGYRPATTYFFSVVAVDRSGHRSAPTAEFEITMAQDITPPVAPSTPVATSRLGTVSVYWDGLPGSGTAWLPDFAYVQVHASTVNDFTPTTVTIVDHLFAEGTSVLTGWAYGVPVYIKLVAVDKAELLSVPSVQATATPIRLVGSDVDPNAISFEQIAFKDPGNVVPDGSFETLLYRSTVSGRSSTAWSFSTADRFHGDWAATISAATFPSTERQLVLMSTAEAQQILAGDLLFMRFAYKATAGASGLLDLVAEWTSQTGVVTVSTITATVRDSTWQTAAGKVTAPAGVKSFRLFLRVSTTGTVGTYWVDAVEVRRTVGTEIIEDAAIGNAQIANLAVNSAKVNDLQVGKLTSGTMTADVLMAGRFFTSATGNRVEFDATGIRLYGGGGATLTGNWLASAGQLRIYNSTDASHTSTGHGLQFGDDNGDNMIIDNNEILARSNGHYSPIYLNREGGPVIIGGKIGGFPLTTDAGVVSADANHTVVVRSAFHIYNVNNGDYAAEYPPFIVGPPGKAHLWMDSNAIGATAPTGDAPSNIQINPVRADGTHHTTLVYVGSTSSAFRRWGSYDGGTRSSLWRGFDGIGVGIRLSGNSSRVFITDENGDGYMPISANSFDLPSESRVKTDIEDIDDPLASIKKAQGKRWRYGSAVDTSGRWRVGPMFEDLPEDVRVPPAPGATEETDQEQIGQISLSSMVGLLWEGVRLLTLRLEELEKKPK